jgi:uncharacterized membrane protein YozB (DUF420 family)
MDAKLAYWTFAFLNMVAIVLIAQRGVRHARRHEVRAHRRCMLTASALVGAFVASYVLKLVLLGREDLAAWDASALLTLRVHELCVFVMLAGGAVAGVRAWQMRAWVDSQLGSVARPNAPAELTGHRRAGWTAFFGAVLGVLTAAAVLLGMYGRTGGAS